MNFQSQYEPTFEIENKIIVSIFFTFFIIKQIREYSNKFWNVISLFKTLVFIIIAIGMYGTKKTLTRLAIRSLRKTEMGEFVSFNVIASFDEVYSYIVAMVTFFTMLKFLKLLRFNKRIGMLSKSLRYARQDLSSFGSCFSSRLLFVFLKKENFGQEKHNMKQKKGYFSNL